MPSNSYNLLFPNNKSIYHESQVELASNPEKEQHKDLKKGIWAYFLLLILEGALRKWFLPALSGPLLIVRDPIVIWLVITAWKRGLLPSNVYITGMVLIGLIGTFTALLLGHGNLQVTLFGARILLFYFPLIFVIGRIFNRDDVIKMGKIILWISIPMTVLIALQFYSPQSAWVNRGIGGDITGGGFSGGALGFFRPPGTFSFINGVAAFFGLTASFIFFFWLNTKHISRLILIIATAGLLASIPLSISRVLLSYILVSFVFTVIAILRKPKYFGLMFIICLVVLGGLTILNKISFFQTATEVFSARFENASADEGGLKGTIVNRYFGEMIKPLTPSSQLPFFGYGLGMGTNVGSVLLSGERSFLLSEGEWGRLIGELGLLMGLAVIFIRLVLALQISVSSYRKLLQGDLLPWMLLAFVLMTTPQGQWAQPTTLGFAVLAGGLMLASLRSSKTIIYA